MNQKIMVWFVAFLLLTTLIIKPASANVVFADVATTDEKYEEIQYLSSLGVIKGYEENGKTYYKPNLSVTRGQAAKMAVVAAGHQPLVVSKSSFTDVRVGTELSSYVERAIQLGLFEQTSGKFSPNAALTRQEMSYILSKAFKFNMSAYSSADMPFPDVSTSNTYASYIKAIYYNGVTRGNNGKFMPASAVTRGQFALFIARAKNEKFRLALPSLPNEVDAAQIIGLIVVTTDGLNVRSSASSSDSTNIVGQVNNGEKLSVYEVQGSWLKISYQGKYAYVSKSYAQFLDADGQTIGAKINTANATEKLNVTVKAASTAKVNGTIASGVEFPVYKETNGYYLTIVNGLPGYVLKSKAQLQQTNSNSGSTEKPDGSGNGATTGTIARVTVNGLNMRVAANGTATTIATLSKGSTITVHSIVGYWANVTAAGKKGYVHKSYIKLINQSGSSINNRIIILDPGHGGKDPGAVKESYTEKAIVLKVSNLVKKKLEAAGAKVYMTRTGDTYPTLEERVAFTNRNFGEIFVSVHVNAATAASAKGTETYYSISSGDQYEEDKKLATYINSEIVKNANMTNRGVKEAQYYVTRNMIIPSVLVELGFISNTEDRNKLINDKYVEIFAQSIYNGIVDYYGKN